jgi:death-on-curing protein
MRPITVRVVIRLHERIIEQTGGSLGIRNKDGLESALAQPYMTFGGELLYPTLAEKASALGFSLIMNHPFVDGNKRVGFIVMALFLKRNGYEMGGTIDDQERLILGVAAGEIGRGELTKWLEQHIVEQQ